MYLNYIENVKSLFEYYKILGEKTFRQLTDEELFRRGEEINNSIPIIVNHLWGNMLSRWSDFLFSDGEKEWRNRDKEFEDVIVSRKDMIDKWNSGWQCLFKALDSVNDSNFDTVIYIRNQKHTIFEAINRQMMHYAYHIGQIVFLGKTIKGMEWKSLSIPKGQSNKFNDEKFSRGKHGGSYTEDIV